MELLSLVGLFGAGNALSNNKKPTNNNIKHRKLPPKNYDNIYSSNNVPRTKNTIQNIANKRINESSDYTKEKKQRHVGWSDQDSEFSGSTENFSDTSSKCSGGGREKDLDLDFFQNATNKMMNNERFEQKINRPHRTQNNGYLSQFEQLTFDNPSTPSAINSSGHKVGPRASESKLETERKLALDGNYSDFADNNDMTYNIVDKEHFTHSNMLPQFSNKTGMGYEPEQAIKLAEVYQRKTDKFTGSTNNLEWRPKTERTALFKPSIGSQATNIYGAPVMTDYYESRYIPGYHKTSEKPFQETRVTPGLNLGYNEIGTHGFHDSFKVRPKTVDELRVASNPKTTYKTPVVNEQKEKQGPLPQKVFKRKPLTFREEKIEDMLPQMTEYKAPSIYGQFDPGNMSTVNRGAKESAYYGPVGNEEMEKTYMYNPDSIVPDNTLREIYINNDRAGNIGNREIEKTYAYDVENAIPELTKREMFAKTERVGGIHNKELNKPYTYDNENWIPNATRRDIHQKTERAGQIGTREIEKNYVYDGENWIPDPTKRDIHSKTERAGQIGNKQFNKYYVYDGENFIPDPTKRDIHSKTERAGQIGNKEFNKPYVYDGVNWIPDPTKREIHAKTERAGQIGNKEFNKPYIYDGVNWIPDPTRRDVHSKTERAGQIGNGEYNKPYVYDGVNWIPNPTKRNIHSKTERAGQIGNREYNKPYVYDGENWIPDPTKRNINDKYDRVGNIGNGELSKAYVYDGENWIPDPTKREIHSKTERAGQIGNRELNKAYVYDGENWIPDPTKREIHSKTERAGQIGNRELSKPYVYDGENWIPDPTKRNINDKLDRAGNGNKFHEFQRSRGDASNMRENVAKEIISQGRGPTLTSYNKGPIMDYTVTELNIPIQNNRELYPQNKDQSTNRLVSASTRIAETLPEHSWRFFSFVDENLKGNPYINNVIHQTGDNIE